VDGGGATWSQGGYRPGRTLGQPFSGEISNLPYDLCAGYWCGGGARRGLYLPLVFRAQ